MEQSSPSSFLALCPCPPFEKKKLFFKKIAEISHIGLNNGNTIQRHIQRKAYTTLGWKWSFNKIGNTDIFYLIKNLNVIWQGPQSKLKQQVD